LLLNRFAGTIKKISKKFTGMIAGLFSKRSGEDMIIGEVLKQCGLITEKQLEKALTYQKDLLFDFGTVLPIGKVIVELGFAKETEIVDVINQHYNISIQSLSDNIKDLITKIRGTLAEDVKAPRFPIWFQLSVTILLVLMISIGSLSYVVLERQREKLYEQTVKVGVVSLNFFANNASVSLLEGDILSLNKLLKNAKGVDGHLYAFIIDNQKIIKAHTDQEKIETQFKKFYNVDTVSKKGDVTYFNYLSKKRNHVLNVSRPIEFQSKHLGEVHVGLSIDFINNQFYEERSFLAFSMLIIIFSGMGVAVLFGLRFSRPISKLVRATREIAKGNYDYKVYLKRNDEFDSLADAFNQMGEELSRQNMMKKSFGKYVGSEVLNMIMDNPETQWLRGRKNEATILFADIRNFTAYSETKEPEDVVEKLNEYFEIATRVILRHGGYIDKFIGDAVLGVFGVPVYHKNHIERAVNAAIEMQEEFLRASEKGNPLLARVGIGIKSGVVLAGNIGSQAKIEYTVIGDTVNIASRLNGIAKAGEIIIGISGKNCIDLPVEFEKLPPQKIKGRKDLVEVYRLLGNEQRSIA